MELSERQRSEKDYFNKYFLAHPYPGYGCFKMLEGARRPYNVDWFSLQLIVDQGLKDKSVLNLGCGLGIKSLLFAKFGARESWGCDISEVAVKTSEALKEALEERDRIQFFVMPAETLRFENERFDYVFGEWVLHHVDIPKAISEVRRVLKKGGRAVFCEWLQWPLFDKIRNRKLIRRLFPAGGFKEGGALCYSL